MNLYRFKRYLSDYGLYVGITLAAFILGFLIRGDCAEAHDCFQQPIQEPTCGYVQVVNPVTGILEQHYVCK